MEAVDVDGDVDVDDVSVGERSVIWDPVTDDVVDRRAHGLREAAVVQRRWILEEKTIVIIGKANVLIDITKN